MKKSQDIEQLCKKLKPVIGEKADRLWYMYLAEDDRGRRDLALEIEIMAEKILNETPLSIKEINLDPPKKNKSTGEYFIGNIKYNNQKLHPLYLRKEDFSKQVGIFAVTGEGKTNLAFLLAVQLIKDNIPITVIDWKRSWRNILNLKKHVPCLNNVTVLTVGRKTSEFNWNPFRAPPGVDKQSWISTIAEVLEKSHLSGPGVAYFFNKIYTDLLRNFKTDDFHPTFFDGMKEIEKTKAFDRELRWKQTALRIFHSFTVGHASKVFNARNPVKLEKLLDKPVIFELDMEMPKPLRVFFSEIMLRWIHLYRLTQGETKNLRNVLFLEEAHNLFNTSNSYNDNTNSLENVYREIRAFGQGLVTITQHPSMLPIYLLGNCHTQIYLGLQHEDDIKTARKALFLNYDEEAYLNKLKVGESIIKIKNRIEPCHVKIPLVPIGETNVTDEFIKKFHQSKLPVLQPEQAKYPENHRFCHHDNKEEEKSKNDLNASHKKLLIDIHKYPFSKIIERYKRLKFNPKYGNQYKDKLVADGYIIPLKIVIRKSKWIILYGLTDKGRFTLSDLGFDIMNKTEGVVHKFWKYKIGDYYKNLGYTVKIEEPRNGNADIVIENEKHKIAVEIETGKSDYIKNIEKNLKHGFDQIISVAINKSVEDKIRIDLIKNRLDKYPNVKVTRVALYNID